VSTTIDNDDDEDEDDAPHHSPGDNCPDSTKRDAYRQALILKIGVESAQETYKQKLGVYRAYLKAAEKRGVDTDAITEALAIRFQDPDEVLIKIREKLKMLDLSGFLPNIRERLLARLDVAEPTEEEDRQSLLDDAYDVGVKAGRSGGARDMNKYLPGTELHQAWDRGWLDGAANLDGETPDARPPKAKRSPKPRPPVAPAPAEADATEEAPLPPPHAVH
jgi:hypothetical protein